MIAAHDTAVMPPALAYRPDAQAFARPASLAERGLIAVLFVAMALSSVAFIEPSPHDFMMLVLAVACLAARVTMDRTTALLFMLLLLWDVAGLFGLLNALNNEKAVQYTATSFYLSFATLIFAWIFARDPMPRLAAMRAGYILSALLGATLGTLGYFHAVPGSDMFELYGRAMGLFKDPNVYAPYLIWPILFVIARAMTQRVTFRDIAILAVLVPGFFLSFSRGAWMHFAASELIVMIVLLMTAPTPRHRMRLIGFGALGIALIAIAVVALLSLSSVRNMFFERAQAIQSYDVGQGGRFVLQELAIGSLFDYPFGMGPFEFARIYGLQQHNVYLQAFLVYSWAGGLAYVMLVVATLVVGFRNLFVTSPWQLYLITAYATFVGVAGEGFIIDTDHWRHFFLLMGMVWGLSAASKRLRNERAGMSRAPEPALAAPQPVAGFAGFNGQLRLPR